MSNTDWKPKTNPAQISKESDHSTPSAVEFYYINISEFHGNGDALWVGSDGFTITQEANRRLPTKKNLLYKFKFAQDDTEQLLTLLRSFISDSLVVKDKLTRSDPTLVYFGIRDANKKMHDYEFWDHEWDRQSPNVQKLKGIIENIITVGKKFDFVEVKDPTDSQRLLQWPKEFFKIPSLEL